MQIYFSFDPFIAVLRVNFYYIAAINNELCGISEHN